MKKEVATRPQRKDMEWGEIVHFRGLIIPVAIQVFAMHFSTVYVNMLA
jgi:hypothetical protein